MTQADAAMPGTGWQASTQVTGNNPYDLSVPPGWGLQQHEHEQLLRDAAGEHENAGRAPSEQDTAPVPVVTP